MADKRNLSFEHATIGFKNFSGKEGQFNPEGRRNFCLFLRKEDGIEMAEDGWNVKWLEPRDPEDEKQAILQVRVNFDNVPPKVVAIKKIANIKTVLNQDTVSILDWAEIENVDAIITPYDWEFHGKHGRTAYLKSIYVTLKEDEFENKYRDVPDSASSSLEDYDR